MPVYKKVNKNFFKKWSKEMSYVLGFFAADGYITVNKRGGQFLCVQITDKKLLESIKKVMGAEQAIGVRPPDKSKSNEKILYRLQIGSVEMCNDLRALGFSERKTRSLAVPNVPNKYFPDFVRGYFDGDGNVWVGDIHKERKTKTKAILVAFTSGSYGFLKKLQEKLHLHGLGFGYIYGSKKGNYYRLQFSTLSALKLYDLMYNRNIKDFLGLYLDRKKKVFEKFKRLRL